MRNRKQRRQKAILPLKLLVRSGNKTHLAHTLDISACGARVVIAEPIAPGTSLTIEFKHRRSSGTAVWCKPLRGSKFDHEMGIQLNTADAAFWGIHLPMREADTPRDSKPIPFSDFINSLTERT
ncbi:MAG TPA: PilZ domain-containing protein [Terriglobales bacterium]|nr:PilZ domain-containing protein [Terriglobales bacterium]